MATDPTPPRRPRWLVVSGVIVGIAVLVIIVLMVVGSGEHGPGRHNSSGTSDNDRHHSTALRS